MAAAKARRRLSVVDEPPWDENLAQRVLLRTSDKRKLLLRIVDGDPLRIGHRCSNRIVELGYILDWKELGLRVATLLASPRTRASLRNGRLETVVSRAIGRAIDERLESLAEEAREGRIDPERIGLPYSALATALGIDPGLGLAIVSRFNSLPVDQRHAFFHVVLAGASLAAYSQAHGLLTEQEVRQLVERATMELLGPTLDPHPKPDLAEGWEDHRNLPPLDPDPEEDDG